MSVCGPCVGVELTYTCRRCANSGDLYQDGHCSRCVLETRLDDLLTSPNGSITPELRLLRDALATTDKPRSLLTWLRRSDVPKLLAELATRGEPITHGKLDALPPTPTTQFVREMLITTAVLPTRNEYLERLPGWVDQFLRDAPADHSTVLSPFVHWFLLRRARRANNQLESAAAHLRSRVRRALELLTWLNQHSLTLETLTQAALEQWLSEGASSRRHIDAFIAWANARGLITDVELPKRHEATRSDSSTTTTATNSSAAASTTKRYHSTSASAARSSSYSAYSPAASSTSPATTSSTPATPSGSTSTVTNSSCRPNFPPWSANCAITLKPRWRLNRFANGTPWLFPGRSPSRPIARQGFAAKLIDHGIAPHAGRNTARFALATELPASVLADLTGTTVGNAIAWTHWAKRDWIDYVAERAQSSTNTAPFE